jgi:hypothetical protein
MNLPSEVINKITSYNATKYTNHVEIEFDYEDDGDEETGDFSCWITMTWDQNIKDFRENAAYDINQMYYDTGVVGNDRNRMNINATVEKLPGMSETIFGDPDYGLVSIDTDGTDADSIKLQLLFYYVREGLNSDRWIKIKEAARLLAARTMVMTLKKIIPPADTPPYDCRDTCQERIKLLEGNEFIFELEWWKKTLANPDEQDTVTIDFKMVNNTRVPLSKIGDTYVYKLKF